MSDILGIFLAFIGQMLLLSILVTTLVQITSAAFSIRQRNFKAVFTKVLKSLRTDSEEDPRANASKLEEAESFYMSSTSDNRIDKMVTPSGISWLSEKGMQRFLKANPIRLTYEQKKTISDKFEEIELFMSKRFAGIMRYISVAFALLIAIVFQANSLEILRKLSTDDAYRQELIQYAESQAIHKLYRASEKSWENALNESIRLYATQNESMAGYVEQIDKGVNSITQASSDYLRILTGEGVPNAKQSAKEFTKILDVEASKYLSEKVAQYDSVIESAAQVDLRIWPDPSYFSGSLAEGFKRAIGILITAILLSLGAPFWFRMLKNVVELRDMLSQAKKG